MKKNELVLGNVVRAYKGNEEFTITAIGEEVVTLNDTKEVKISTLLKNYKLVEEIPVEATFNGEPPVAIEEEVDDSETTDSFDKSIEALAEEIEDRQSERSFLDEVNNLLVNDANEENNVDAVENEEPVVEASQTVETEEAVKEKTSAKNAKTKAEKRKAKEYLNFCVGFLQNRDPYTRAQIVGLANDLILSLIDENTLYCNTDSIVCLKEREDLKLGEDIGEWKIEKKGLFAFKGFNYQWDFDPPSIRGKTKSYFDSGWDILKDDLPVCKNMYYFDPIKGTISESEQ